MSQSNPSLHVSCSLSWVGSSFTLQCVLLDNDHSLLKNTIKTPCDKKFNTDYFVSNKTNTVKCARVFEHNRNTKYVNSCMFCKTLFIICTKESVYLREFWWSQQSCMHVCLWRIWYVIELLDVTDGLVFWILHWDLSDAQFLVYTVEFALMEKKISHELRLYSF